MRLRVYVFFTKKNGRDKSLKFNSKRERSQHGYIYTLRYERVKKNWSASTFFTKIWKLKKIEIQLKTWESSKHVYIDMLKEKEVNFFEKWQVRLRVYIFFTKKWKAQKLEIQLKTWKQSPCLHLLVKLRKRSFFEKFQVSLRVYIFFSKKWKAQKLEI